MAEPSTPSFAASRTEPERRFPAAAIGLAGGLIAVLLGLLVVFGGHRKTDSNQPLPPDPYAAQLKLSQLAMSESTSLSGGKSTFLDGHVSNTGDKTVTAVTVQVFFANDTGMPAHLQTVPLGLIRTREPYVDTQPVSAAPLAPGADREFRLIFESIPENWNTQLPEVRVVRVTAK